MSYDCEWFDLLFAKIYQILSSNNHCDHSTMYITVLKHVTMYGAYKKTDSGYFDQ